MTRLFYTRPNRVAVFTTGFGGQLLSTLRSRWASGARLASTLNAEATEPKWSPTDLVKPWEERRPFAQKNRRRDAVLSPRFLPAVPSTHGESVQAWLSSWEDPHCGIVQLRADIWDMPLRPDIVHRVVFWQRACMRAGVAKTKGRSEVSGGGKKPRPQKGTGKSRQGSIRAPHFRGGANAFPKLQRSYKYFLPMKVQTLGLKVALSDKYRRGALVVMDDLALSTHKTSELVSKATDLGIDLKKHRVMLMVEGDHDDPTRPAPRMNNLATASGNIHKITTQTTHECNVFDLVRHQLLVLDRKSLSALEQRFDDVTAVGHLHGEMASKLPLFHSMPSGDVHHDPRKARGRKHFDPRVVPWEKW